MFFKPGTIRIPFGAGDPVRRSGRRLQRVELDAAHDAHARAALEAYADSCTADMPWLADLLRELLGSAHPDLTHCAGTVRRVFGLAHEWAAAQPDYANAAWVHVGHQLDAALEWRAAAHAAEAEFAGSADATAETGWTDANSDVK